LITHSLLFLNRIMRSERYEKSINEIHSRLLWGSVAFTSGLVTEGLNISALIVGSGLHENVWTLPAWIASGVSIAWGINVIARSHAELQAATTAELLREYTQKPTPSTKLIQP
jgi:hypothetical protein